MNQWLNSFCSASRTIGLYCSVQKNSAEVGKTVTILNKRIGLDAELHPCDARGANIVINLVFEGRKVQLRKLELKRTFTLPIPYLSFAFLGVTAGTQIVYAPPCIMPTVFDALSFPMCAYLTFSF